MEQVVTLEETRRETFVVLFVQEPGEQVLRDVGGTRLRRVLHRILWRRNKHSVTTPLSLNNIHANPITSLADQVLDLKLKGKDAGGREHPGLKCIDNIVEERATNLKQVEERGLHLNRIAWRKCLTG